MNEITITITEALCELKTLNNRISKEINSGSFVTSVVANKAPAGYKDLAAFDAKAKSTLKSIQDLIDRRNKIKAAIVASNDFLAAVDVALTISNSTTTITV